MSDRDIVRMANQIAGFFASYDHDEAVAGVAGHIAQFWEPRMRQALADVIERGGEGLDPLVIAAAKTL